jgi:glycosyltransferase involved in cell wall biosynthesis
MRVAFVCNQDNNNYRICKWMRSVGVDAELYHFSINVEASGKRSLPELVDPELSGGYPDWIHVVEGRPGIVRNKQKELDAICRKTNVAITSGSVGVRVAHFLNVPDIFHYALGGEITTNPWKPIEEIEKFHVKLAQFRYRKNLDIMKGIFSDFPPQIDVLRKHGLGDKIISWSMPEDVLGNRKRMNQDLRRQLMQRYGGKKRVFVWASRLNMDPSQPYYKAPEIFAGALHRLKQERGLDDIGLIIGQHGFDADAFKKIVADYGLNPHIDWIDHQPYVDLLAYLGLDNAVVFDNLCATMDGLGGVGRECMSVGSMLVKSIDVGYLDSQYGQGCPAINAYSVDTCYDAMVRLLDDDIFHAARAQMDLWSKCYLHYPRNIMGMIYEILSRSTGGYRESLL